MRELSHTQFGNPILREKAKRVDIEKIKSQKVQQLIKDMRHTLISKKLGVGLAAPQVGQSLALAVICVRPTKHRPKVTKFDLVIINPEITQTFGRKVPMREGCISSGIDKNGLFAKVPRYKKVRLKFFDEKAKQHDKTYEGLPAQVIQHEVDHLNGVLFVDQVKDTKSYMTYKEYLKRVKRKKQ